MAEGRAPLGHVLDLVLYAPVGLFTLAQRELPELIAAGKTRVDNQITLARFIGKMAVRQGTNEFKRRMRTAEEARSAKPVIDTSATVLSITAAATPTTSRDAAAAVDLPIEGYDSLAASQVVQRLGSLDGFELEAIRQYEEVNRTRRTILGKIAQLQAR
jgi:hypothetical protein